MKFLKTITKAVEICFSREETIINLNPEKQKPKVWHRGTCNMDPHEVAKMVPSEVKLNRVFNEARYASKKIKPTKVRP